MKRNANILNPHRKLIYIICALTHGLMLPACQNDDNSAKRLQEETIAQMHDATLDKTIRLAISEIDDYGGKFQVLPDSLYPFPPAIKKVAIAYFTSMRTDINSMEDLLASFENGVKTDTHNLFPLDKYEPLIYSLDSVNSKYIAKSGCDTMFLKRFDVQAGSLKADYAKINSSYKQAALHDKIRLFKELSNSILVNTAHVLSYIYTDHAAGSNCRWPPRLIMLTDKYVLGVGDTFKADCWMFDSEDQNVVLGRLINITTGDTEFVKPRSGVFSLQIVGSRKGTYEYFVDATYMLGLDSLESRSSFTITVK